jgi:excisionase family DNA binding protein
MVTAWLTCAAVAEDLGVSPRTVHRWIDRGALPAVRLPGGQLRISEAALSAALAGWQTHPDGRMLAPAGDTPPEEAA